MKTVLLHLLIAGSPFWLSSNASEASDCDAEAKAKSVVVVVQGDDADGAGVARVIGGSGIAYITVGHDASDESDGRSEKKKIYVKTSVKVVGGGEGGWLGVAIKEVPEALVAQLGTKGHGVMIESVVDDSPADDAGVYVHDILLSVGGDVVVGDIGDAVRLIKSRKAGDTIDIRVLRDGEEKSLTVTLGSRADMSPTTLRWISEDGERVEIEDRIKTRGRFLFKGDDGEWVMKDLGDVDELLDLPENVRMFVPKSGSRSTQVFMEHGKSVLKTKVEQDGTVIAIKREGDGPIVVSRVDEDGDEVERSYDTAEDLEDGDPEAFELWEEIGDAAVIHLNVDGLGKRIRFFGDELDDLHFDFEFDADEWKEHAEEWKEHAEEWQHHIEGGLKEATEAYERAMEQFEKIHEDWESGAGLPALEKIEKLQNLFHYGDDDHEALLHGAHGKLIRLDKPRHTFEVRTDGTIEVRIRKGDSELVQLFDDEEDLENRKPDLAEKYRELMDIDE